MKSPTVLDENGIKSPCRLINRIRSPQPFTNGNNEFSPKEAKLSVTKMIKRRRCMSPANNSNNLRTPSQDQSFSGLFTPGTLNPPSSKKAPKRNLKLKLADRNNIRKIKKEVGKDLFLNL